jgi:ATPase subunit of ABC transporter with duplicated ATPase domains
MAVISLQDVGVIAPRPLFQNITFRFGIGDHVGLIAGNGGGKSTLLRCVAGLAEPDAGVITMSRGARVGYVEQDMPASLLRLTLHEAVRRALSPAEREHESWRVGAVLDEFETPDAVRDQPVAALSGGWQRMVLLARVWVTQPDALLLDELTNHLDAEKIGFLETWINGIAARTPMLIASHDRSFLDNCTTRSLFLRPDISRIYAHPYTAARRLLAEDDAAQERKHTKDAKEVDRLRRNAGELRNIGVNSGSDLLQKKSMQLRDRATRLEQTLRPAPVDRFAAIRLVNSGTHAKVLVSLKDVTVRAPDGCKLFHVAKFELRQGDRLVLLGANGVGKSQLIAMLRRATNAALPGIHISRSVALGYADQGMAHLPGEQTLRRFISARPGIGDAQATQLLASAGFEVAMHGNAISKLSPGQKARLGMLALRLAEPNFYLLDEPTNHVDIPGQEQLEAELLAHGATCVLVSHDRHFVAAVGTRFLHIEGGQARETNRP